MTPIDPSASRDAPANRRSSLSEVSGRVSVIVPTLNSGRTLEECLESIRAQTHSDVELIVVDNHSCDDSGDIAMRLADRFVVRGPERSAQRNTGAGMATGEFLLFVDGDMLVAPEVAKQIVEAFRFEPSHRSLVTPLRCVGDNFWARCRALEKDLYVGDPDMEAARAYRRCDFVRVGGYDEELNAGEDWDLSERVNEGADSIGRIQAGLVHDEGRVALRDLLAKKFYYGRTLRRYVNKHPRLAVRKVFRLALIRNFGVLIKRPILGSGLLLMKLLEFVAALAGAATSTGASKTAGSAGADRGSLAD
jgi:glycosyltransferase involved in cell wall biosynthesis